MNLRQQVIAVDAHRVLALLACGFAPLNSGVLGTETVQHSMNRIVIRVAKWIGGVLVLLLAAIIVQNVIAARDETKQRETINTIVRITNACIRYREAKGTLPPSSDPIMFIKAISQYTQFKVTSIDEWGWPMRIYQSGNEIIVWSPGKDGRFWPSIPQKKTFTRSFKDDLICIGDHFQSWPDGFYRD